MNSRKGFYIYIPVLLAMVLWSFSFIWYKQVFVHYRPVTVIVLRLVIAIPLLFVLSLAAGKLQRIQRIHLKWFILLGFFEPFLYFMGECYGMNLIAPSLGAIIISLIPLMAPIPARYFFREKFSFSNYVGLFISLTGLVLVVAGDRSAKPAAIAGVLLMLLAAVSAVCHSIFVRKLSEYYSSFTIVTYQSTFGLVYFIPVFAITDFNVFIHQAHTFTTLLPVIKLAVFASTLAFLLFVYSIKNLGMARTNVFVYLIPVFTAILSYFIIHEKFGLTKIAGILVVVAGLIFSQVTHMRRLDHAG
jgi:drug/metabolite transporter (DMT)-like permease